MHFKIDIKPVGVNHMYHARGGRHGRFLSSEAGAYKAAIGYSAKQAMYDEHLQVYKYPVVKIFFTYGDRRKHDIDSALKLTLDAMNGITYEDDNDIEELHVYKCYEKGKYSVEIEVSNEFE